MNALGIDVIFLSMAPLAPFCAFRSHLADVVDLVRPVAISADRCIQFPLAENGVVNALEGLGIFIEVAAPAALRRGKGEVPTGPEIPLRVIFGREAEVAVRTAQFAMDRGFQPEGVYLEQEGLVVLKVQS